MSLAGYIGRWLARILAGAAAIYIGVPLVWVLISGLTTVWEHLLR